MNMQPSSTSQRLGINKIVLNIAHTSLEFPYATRWQGNIEQQIRHWTDVYTDALFHPDFRFASQVVPVRYPYSRFFCDVERLEADPLESIGQGIVYTRFQGCRRTPSYEERMLALQSYYHHQCQLLSQVADEHTLLLDCHSFPAELSADVDICLGYNDDWSKPSDALIGLVRRFFEEQGAAVGINVPYSNAISPRKHFSYPCLMIEVNKRFYLGPNGAPDGRLDAKNRTINNLYALLLGTPFTPPFTPPRSAA